MTEKQLQHLEHLLQNKLTYSPALPSKQYLEHLQRKVNPITTSKSAPPSPTLGSK